MAITIVDAGIILFILSLVGLCFAGLTGVVTLRKKHHSDRVVKDYASKVQRLCDMPKCEPSEVIRLLEMTSEDNSVDLLDLHKQTIASISKKVAGDKQ